VLDLSKVPSTVIFQLQEVLVIFHQLHAVRDSDERGADFLASAVQMLFNVRGYGGGTFVQNSKLGPRKKHDINTTPKKL
jgi:hypothetical protein